MILSNASNLRFNGSNVEMVKFNGVVIYSKKEEDNPTQNPDSNIIVHYTATSSGVLPTFNTEYTDYTVAEVDNGDNTWTTVITRNGNERPTSIRFKNNNTSLVSVYKVDTSNANTLYSIFDGCSSLTSLDTFSFDTSNVTNMNYAFYRCSSLTSLDLSSFDTSNVATMNGMFRYCAGLTSLDLSNFDVSKVTSMNSIFDDCSKLTSLKSMKNISTNLTIVSSLDKESILDVVNNLAAVSSTKTLKISNAQLSQLSADKITEANNKGWTISA